MHPYVIIDNGHGAETPGKQSPDGTYKEWEWTRRFARLLAHKLSEAGIEATLLVPENSDVSLSERCSRANSIYRHHPDAVLISLHTNAVGDGSEWHGARGWSAHVARNASAKSRRLASILGEKMEAAQMTGNRWKSPQGYLECNFYICRATPCPAVLTENFFHDNRKDLAFFSQVENEEKLLKLYVEAIEEYFKGEESLACVAV